MIFVLGSRLNKVFPPARRVLPALSTRTMGIDIIAGGRLKKKQREAKTDAWIQSLEYSSAKVFERKDMMIWVLQKDQI